MRGHIQLYVQAVIITFIVVISSCFLLFLLLFCFRLFACLFVYFFFSCGGLHGTVLKHVPLVLRNFLSTLFVPIRLSLFALSLQIPLSMQTNTPIITATSQYVSFAVKLFGNV